LGKITEQLQKINTEYNKILDKEKKSEEIEIQMMVIEKELFDFHEYDKKIFEQEDIARVKKEQFLEKQKINRQAFIKKMDMMEKKHDKEIDELRNKMDNAKTEEMKKKIEAEIDRRNREMERF